MIQVTIGTNTSRTRTVVDENTTLKKALTDAEVDYSVANVHLDGVALKAGDIDKTFAEMNVKESCFLIAVVKVDNN